MSSICLKTPIPGIGHWRSVRGLGAMQAIEFGASAEARLVISDEEFAEALEALHAGVMALAGRAAPV